MSQYRRHLLNACYSALFSLPLGSLIGGLASSIYSFVQHPESFTHALVSLFYGLVVALVACVVGLLPCFLIGVPAYAAMALKGKASYLTSALLGTLPGVVLLPFTKELGYLFAIFGVLVALITHRFATKVFHSS